MPTGLEMRLRSGQVYMHTCTTSTAHLRVCVACYNIYCTQCKRCEVQWYVFFPCTLDNLPYMIWIILHGLRILAIASVRKRAYFHLVEMCVAVCGEDCKIFCKSSSMNINFFIFGWQTNVSFSEEVVYVSIWLSTMKTAVQCLTGFSLRNRAVTGSGMFCFVEK